MDSKFLQLKKTDFWKGIIVATLSTACTGLCMALDMAVDFASFNWQIILLSAASGFVSYITKNLLTNSNGEAFRKERK